MRDTTSKPDREHALGQIRTAMIEKKLTQAELADASDCHEKTIQNFSLAARCAIRPCSTFAWCWGSTSCA